MPKRDISFYVVDVFIAIDKVHRYTKNFTCAEDLLYDEMSWDATIRELEIIGEATKHLLNAEIIPKHYRRIVDFRNQINHAYFGINESIVWDVVKDKLNIYKDDLEYIIVSENLSLQDAIESIKSDKFSNDFILSVLLKLEKL